MIGLRLLQEFLDGIDTKEFSEAYITKKRAYECLDLAACIFARDTRALKRETEITTAAEQQEYPLPPSFIDLYMRDADDNFFVRYTGDNNIISWPIQIPPDYIYLMHETTPQDYPPHFSIEDVHAEQALITGAATSPGAAANGRSILEDSTKNFLTTNRVCPRDRIYNNTAGAEGMVLSVIDATHLYTALFSGNNIEEWDASDTYTIIPATAALIKLAYPSLTAGHKIAVPYVSLPSPVFWDLGAWTYPERVCKAITSGAAALFKTGKTEYQEAQSLGNLFDAEVLRYKIEQGAKTLKQKSGRGRYRW